MLPMLPAYAELHCLSNFSFLRGASHAEELVERAHALGYAALAITDECSFAGMVRAHVAAKAHGLKLIVGAEVTLTDGMKPGLKLVLLAMNRAGYGNLSAVLTLGRRRAEKGSYRLTRGDLAQGIPDCIALWVPGKVGVTEGNPRGTGDTPNCAANARWLAARFPDRCWIAFERLLAPDDSARLAHFSTLGLPLVAAGDVHMHARGRRPLQDALTALRLGTSVDRAGQALFANGERHLRSRLRLARLYPPELLAETVKVAALCNFSLDELRYEYPEEIVPPGSTPAAYLRSEVDAGLVRRYAHLAGGVPDKVRAQIEHELVLIAAMQYEAYFLTVYDIVGFARRAGILCQGRGSAANSAVCFALGITEVDPARASMLFERFISKERNEPPDIDVDFEHQRREEVIQYIYAKYGRERAALAAAVITWRTRGALRDAGRALGFPLAQIEALTSSMAWWDRQEDWSERIKVVGLDPESPGVKKWLWIAQQLKGFPRHLTQHVGGFVISRGRLDRLVPVENAAMAERSVIQWDKDDIDALGLMKVDVLALGMLSAIRRALDCISARRNRRVTHHQFTLADIPAEDAATYAMIGKADTVGVFQIESRAQMAMLPRLRPACFYDLVVEVALVRPGPIQGDMVHPYLRRRQGLEPVTYPSEAVRGVLERTLGVPIFQEQAMQLAIVAAGFTPGEADQLRRAMAAWKRRPLPPAPLPVEGGDGCSPPVAAPVGTLPPPWGGPAAGAGGLAPFREKLLAGMRARGYADEFAEALYRQIEGFGDYGFPESHAASFALLVYVSAWLKCHEPAAFLVGLLNSQPMGFYSASQLVQDARRHGVTVLPVDVTASEWESVMEGALDGGAVRLGLNRVKGLGQGAGERIAAARCDAAFRDAADLAARARLDRGDLDALAAAGTLARLSGHRRAAAWEAAAVPLQRDLFLGVATREDAPPLPAPREGEEIVADYAHLGLTLGRHPLALLRARLAAMRYVDAATLRCLTHNCPVRLAGLVTCRQRPGTASGVVFVTLEDETGLANIIVHGRLAERQREPLLGSRLLGVLGVLQREGAVVHLIARRLVDHDELLSHLPGQLAVPSRNFC